MMVRGVRWSYAAAYTTMVALVLVAAWCGVASAAESLSAGSESLLTGPLITEGPLTSSEFLAEEETKLASPEAVRRREESETAYSGLTSTKSEELVGSAFPGLINTPDGGLVKLPEGDRILGFSSDFAASVQMPSGKRGAIDSVAPIAVETSSGRVPVDVSPRQVGSGFEATMPAAHMRVRAGGRLSEGASLSDLGVRLTAVAGDGAPLESLGRVDGAGIFYGNSEDPQAGVVDMDTLVKLGVYGVSEETILRSQRSPEKLYFKVGLPEGASLEQEGAGPIRVLMAGQVVASILAPGASDGAGTFVPVAATVAHGDTVVLTVPHPAGRFQYRVCPELCVFGVI